jgi:hypothetical protein
MTQDADVGTIAAATLGDVPVPERFGRRLLVPRPPLQAGEPAAKSTSAVVTVPAVRPGALWFCQ